MPAGSSGYRAEVVFHSRMQGVPSSSPTDDGLPGQGAGFENTESEDVERFVGVPEELGAIDANEEDSVGNFRTRIAGSFCEARYLAFHATTSCVGRV